MRIDIIRTGKTVCLEIRGRLDTVTAPALEKTVQEMLAEYESVCLDLTWAGTPSEEGLQLLQQLQQERRPVVFLNADPMLLRKLTDMGGSMH